MAGTKEGAAKTKARLIKELGAEGYEAEMKRRQSKGGSAKRLRSFEVDPKLASSAGRKGAINRHYRGKVQG